MLRGRTVEHDRWSLEESLRVEAGSAGQRVDGSRRSVLLIDYRPDTGDGEVDPFAIEVPTGFEVVSTVICLAVASRRDLPAHPNLKVGNVRSGPVPSGSIADVHRHNMGAIWRALALGWQVRVGHLSDQHTGGAVEHRQVGVWCVVAAHEAADNFPIGVAERLLVWSHSSDITPLFDSLRSLNIRFVDLVGTRQAYQ
jgi:hypothetical protein